MDVPSTLCVVNLVSEAYILLSLFVDMVKIYVVQHDFEFGGIIFIFILQQTMFAISKTHQHCS